MTAGDPGEDFFCEVERRRARPEQPYRAEEDYRDSGGHDGGGHQGRGKRRHRGLLGDLFDFD